MASPSSCSIKPMHNWFIHRSRQVKEGNKKVKAKVSKPMVTIPADNPARCVNADKARRYADEERMLCGKGRDAMRMFEQPSST